MDSDLGSALNAILIIPRSRRYHTSLDCELVDEDKAIVSTKSRYPKHTQCTTDACKGQVAYHV
jgi:hypothetical protein